MIRTFVAFLDELPFSQPVYSISRPTAYTFNQSDLKNSKLEKGRSFDPTTPKLQNRLPDTNPEDDVRVLMFVVQQIVGIFTGGINFHSRSLYSKEPFSC